MRWQSVTTATESQRGAAHGAAVQTVHSKKGIVLQGANIRFELEGGASGSLPPDAQLEVYTTRPDTVRIHSKLKAHAELVPDDVCPGCIPSRPMVLACYIGSCWP